MNTKYSILLLVLSFLTLGFVQAFAEQPPVNSPLPKNIQSVNENEAAKTPDFEPDVKELSVYEFYSSDSSSGEGFYPFLTIKPSYSLDSSNFIEVMKYLKQIIPVTSEIEDRDFEMIEIL